MLEINPVRADDLPALSRRLRAELRGCDFSVENLRRKIWDADHRDDLNLVAWDGTCLKAVLLGMVRGGTAWIKVATTAPHRDAADRLLAIFEDRVRELGVAETHVSGAPSYFVQGIDPTDTVTLRFYLDHGYRKTHETTNMVSDLLESCLDTTADEERLAASGYQFQRVRPDEETTLRSFITEHFNPGWADEAARGLEDEPSTVHVARYGDEVVAFAAAEVTNPGWFGPTGTAPAHRRRGIGRVLLLRALADLRELGYREAEIGWVGPLGFYARHCGARVSRVLWMLRKDLDSR